MRIDAVEFAGAIGQKGQAPPGRLPQIAFSGRSNVGKSSLINRLLGRTRTPVARVSSTPGRTQQINFFRVTATLDNEARSDFFLVDLPGYGYARVPVGVRGTWRPLIESYLSGSDDLRGVVQLVDARHEPTGEDRKMVAYLAKLGVPTLVVATKIDKVVRSKVKAHLRQAVEALGIDEEQLLPFSSETGEGREALLESLGELLRDSKEAT